MKTLIQFHIILFCALYMVGCASTQPTYMSKNSIRQLKTIIFIIEAESGKPEIIDIGGIRTQAYNSVFSGGPELYGALGVLIASGIAEVTSQYEIKKALGEDENSITTLLNNEEALHIIFSGISESFEEKTSECDYIDFEKIIFLNNQNEDTINKYKKVDADHIVNIKYKFGIGVSKKYPPQPAIVSLLEIYNPKSKELVEKTEISSNSYSLYSAQEEVPSLEEYSKNNAKLFKHDLRKAAKIVGGEIARLYTYY